MAFMSDWIYSEEDLRQEVEEDRERIREEIKQAIENGVIKIESGREKLFEILKWYDVRKMERKKDVICNYRSFYRSSFRIHW